MQSAPRPSLPSLLLPLALAASAAAQRDGVWYSNTAFPPTANTQAGPIAFDPWSSQLTFVRTPGQTLAWNGTSLVVVATSLAISDIAVATSTIPGFTGVMAFGGRFGTSVTGQTSLFTRGTWTRSIPSVQPPARYRASMASRNGQPVLFGGIDAAGNPLNDTWAFFPIGPTGKWLEALSLAPPPARHSAAMCPEAGGGLLLFGGDDGTSLRNDTWRLGGFFDWTQVTTPVAPPPGTGPMSFDPGHGEIIHVDPPTGTTWRFDCAASTWEALPSATVQLSVPFAGTLSGGRTYMAFDPEFGEHLFVDATLGVSRLSFTSAIVAHTQPAGCTPALGIALSAGSPRTGQSYSVAVSSAPPGGIVLFAIGASPLEPPFAITATCLAFFGVLLDAQIVGIDAAGVATRTIQVPASTDMIGFTADHQALEYQSLAVTDDLAVTFGR